MAHPRSPPFHAGEDEAEGLEDHPNHTLTWPTRATMGASLARLSSGREGDRSDQVAEDSEGGERARPQSHLMSCLREPSTTW